MSDQHASNTLMPKFVSRFFNGLDLGMQTFENTMSMCARTSKGCDILVDGIVNEKDGVATIMLQRQRQLALAKLQEK